MGAYSIGFRLLLKALDWNALAEIMVMSVRTSGDYKRFRDAAKPLLLDEAATRPAAAAGGAKAVKAD